jgi:hypothetical protein
MPGKKGAPTVPPPKPFTKFSDAFQALSVMLDKIRDAFPQGKAAVGTAYGAQHGRANDACKKVVTALAPSQVDLFAGLTFTDAHDPVKKRTDVTNSMLTAWDKAAAKYLHGQNNDGDSARADMKKRYEEFDKVVTNLAKTAVTPDT